MSDRLNLCRSYLSRPFRRRALATSGFTGHRRKAFDAGLRIADKPTDVDVALHNSANSSDSYEFLELKRLQIA